MSDLPWPEDLAVLVPVYNHAHRVGEVVAGLIGAGARVLVVDDGSTDGSGDQAAAAGAEVLRHPLNQGKGAALLTGFSILAQRGWSRVLTCDADAQHPLSECRKLAAGPVEPHTIVIGVRDMSPAPAPNRFGRAFSNFWVWLACGVDPGDSQSGLRIYPPADILALGTTGRRYHFEIENLVRGVWAGLTIRQVPVAVIYPPDRITHFHLVKDNWRTAWAFTRLIARRLLPWPHRCLVPRPGRFGVRSLLTQGLAPGPVSVAAGLGAAVGVAPIPGIQTVVAGYLALKLRLNLPVVLVASNISFGPMLAFWLALSVAVGRTLRLAGCPLTACREVWHELAGLGSWWQGEAWRQLSRFLVDGLLGSLLVVPVVGLVVGLATFQILRRCRRGAVA